MKVIVVTSGKWKGKGIRKTITVPNIQPCTLILALKFIIFQLEEIPLYNQNLHFHGKRLSPTRSLCEYGIVDNDEIDLVTTDKNWSINVNYDGRPIELPYPYNQFIPFSSNENNNTHVKKIPNIEKLLHTGKYGPLVLILSYFEEIDILLNVVHVNCVNKFFFDLVFNLWENGSIQPDKNYGNHKSDLMFFYFILGFINENIFLKLIELKKELREPFSVYPSGISKFFVARSSSWDIWAKNRFLLDAFNQDYRFSWLRICIEGNYLEVLRYFVKELKFGQSSHLIFNNNIPYLSRCITLNRPKEMIFLIFECERESKGQVLLRPKGIVDFLYNEVDDHRLEMITDLLKNHRHEQKGNVFNIRKVIIYFVQSVKRGYLKGTLEEYLKIEQHFPNFILKYDSMEVVEQGRNTTRRVYRRREDTYTRRDQEGLEQEFSYVYSSKKIFTFLNYHLHLFKWDLLKYLITKDFGVWKNSHRKKFKISPKMKEIEELKKFVLDLNEGPVFHNLHERDLESWKEMFSV